MSTTKTDAMNGVASISLTHRVQPMCGSDRRGLVAAAGIA
jgi:hypothetical protein